MTDMDTWNILIVDDEKEITDLLEVYLSSEGYRVFKFYCGQDALDCIEREHIDLAILDVMLPDVDGFTLCRKIREKYFFPVIMLTAKIEETESCLVPMIISRSRFSLWNYWQELKASCAGQSNIIRQQV